MVTLQMSPFSGMVNGMARRLALTEVLPNTVVLPTVSVQFPTAEK
jgi:hypothetical protein